MDRKGGTGGDGVASDGGKRALRRQTGSKPSDNAVAGEETAVGGKVSRTEVDRHTSRRVRSAVCETNQNVHRDMSASVYKTRGNNVCVVSERTYVLCQK